ncbi:hypothetical protein [Streptomyces sp. NPDC058664]|uniref:hypothetical protein n=1 Tax=unclassified Streptomyces TaxID=2593676 RepID=UPI0036656596
MTVLDGPAAVRGAHAVSAVTPVDLPARDRTAVLTWAGGSGRPPLRSHRTPLALTPGQE